MAFYILMSFFFGWLMILSFYVIKMRGHYFRLIERTKKQKIDDILDKLIEDDEKNSKEITLLKKEIDKINKDSLVYFNRIGLVRFNPFGKSEGEQSFVLSLLDSNDSGIVINFIYTHDGARIYAKKVKNGEGVEYPLSNEEKQAIKQVKIKNT